MHPPARMENPLTASFKWTADELLTAQRVHMRYSPLGRKFRRAMFVTAPISILFGVGIFVTRGFHPAGVAFVVFGSALLLSPLLVRQTTLKHYARRPDRDMVVTYEFYPERIVSTTEASSATLEWRMISRVFQTGGGFLLYPNDRIFHWVPTHAFPNASDVEAFAKLARSKVPQYDQKG
jgi:hypothetical protein